MNDDLRKDIEELLNRHCAENNSGTPDWILSHYLMDSLAAYDMALKRREQWYGRSTSDGLGDTAGGRSSRERFEEWVGTGFCETLAWHAWQEAERQAKESGDE